MSQHQAGVGYQSQTFKLTALTWKVKDKATSQLARSDARLAVSGVNQGGHGETVLPKVLPGSTAVFRLRRVSDESCLLRSHKWHRHFIILKQSVLGSSSTYMYLVAPGLPDGESDYTRGSYDVATPSG